MVDWRQLKKWDIPEDRLPAGTVILYREPDAWEQYRRYFWIVGAVLLVQTTLIVLLIIQIRRGKRFDLAIRRLTRRLIHASEDERRHIARELHDDFGQRLSLLAVQLSFYNQGRPDGDSKASRALNDSIRELDTLITDVHNLSHRLHSAKLEHLGLEVALKEMCQQISRQHNLHIDLQMNGLPVELNRDTALCFYRVAQEALNNVIKHSGASWAQVSLAVNDQRLKLLVRDFGVGFDSKTTLAGLGIITMEERLRTIAGTFSVISKPDKGTILTAEAPISQRNRQTAQA